MRQRSPGTASQQSWERERERPGGGALARGAVPQRLPGSSYCLCVTSGRLAGEAVADASNTVHRVRSQQGSAARHHYLAHANNFPRKSTDVDSRTSAFETRPSNKYTLNEE